MTRPVVRVNLDRIAALLGDVRRDAVAVKSGEIPSDERDGVSPAAGESSRLPGISVPSGDTMDQSVQRAPSLRPEDYEWTLGGAPTPAEIDWSDASFVVPPATSRICIERSATTATPVELGDVTESFFVDPAVLRRRLRRKERWVIDSQLHSVCPTVARKKRTSCCGFRSHTLNLPADAKDALPGPTLAEVEGMHIEDFDDMVSALVQQRMRRSRLPLLMYRGMGGVLFIIVLGFILLAMGLLLEILGWRHKEYVSSNYQVGDSNLYVDVKEEMKAPIYAYVKISNFKANARSFIVSRPPEILASFSCGDYKTVESAFKVRSKDSFPEVVRLGLSAEANIFPCGVSSFSYFNDAFDFPFSMGLKTDAVAAFEKLVLFAVNVDATPDETSWISSLEPSFRAWFAMQYTSTFLVGVGKFEKGVIPAGKHSIKIPKNVWPAEYWLSSKALVLQTFSPIGSKQTELARTSMGWGGGMILIGVGIFVALKIRGKGKPAGSGVEGSGTNGGKGGCGETASAANAA